ncbi:MAG TPA: ADP-forming succinate--CoA ligase subunit beta [Actinomycetota bacterium]|nr:ADP-forming succinate--CoA ligase subunit beta [Actinomycetota bacterium]
MDLLEHQGKQLFRQWGLRTPESRVAATPDEAEDAARALGGTVAVKAQVRTGGRGKAGGVRVVSGPQQAREAAEAILSLSIKGHAVRRVLVEAGVQIASQSYFSIMLDRSTKTHLMIGSAQGGVDIEAVAASTPEAITRVGVDPLIGLQTFQVNKMLAGLGIPADSRKAGGHLVRTLYRLYLEADATLVEVNPLVVTTDGDVVALDSKVTLDDSALFRHPEMADYGVEEGDDSQESRAAEQGLHTFVKLDGNIGIVGNGAGLVMSTLDLVDQVGGKAANFLDVGGGADAKILSNALQLILADGRARSVLVNIFGGITRCDLVAEGVVDALGAVVVDIPIVVRLAGTNAEAGRRILDRAGHPMLVSAQTMLEAAEKAVEATR